MWKESSCFFLLWSSYFTAGFFHDSTAAFHSSKWFINTFFQLCSCFLCASFPKEHSKRSHLQLLHLFIVEHVVAWGAIFPLSLFLLEVEGEVRDHGFWRDVSKIQRRLFFTCRRFSCLFYVLYRLTECPAARQTSSVFQARVNRLITTCVLTRWSFRVWSPEAWEDESVSLFILYTVSQSQWKNKIKAVSVFVKRAEHNPHPICSLRNIIIELITLN